MSDTNRADSYLEVFDQHFAPKLGLRAPTFRRLFAKLLEAKSGDFVIVETGCARSADNFRGDGQSTTLFADFVQHVGGRLITIDIDPVACAFAYSISGKNPEVYCGDSVHVLNALTKDESLREHGIDLVYLDSYDVDFAEPHESSLHHLFELCSVMPLCRERTILALDDSPRSVAGFYDEHQQFVVSAEAGLTGKAKYISQFCTKIGLTPLFSEYQVAWSFPPGSQGTIVKLTSDTLDVAEDHEITQEALAAIHENARVNQLILKNLWHELDEEKARADREALRAQEQEQRADREAQRALEEELRANALYRSLTWRVTAPLRTAAKYLLDFRRR